MNNLDDLSPIIIAGPTASGKSFLAEKMAQEKDSVIINADSMQVFEGLPILTAQPLPLQEHHFLYHYKHPVDDFHVNKWLEDSEERIAVALAQSCRPIIIGGTGFYLKALIEGLSDIPSIHPDIEKEAESLLQNKQHLEMLEYVRSMDPLLPSHIHTKDSVRLKRAWCITKQTEKPLTTILEQRVPPKFKFFKVLVQPETVQLNHFIEKRTSEMWKAGVVKEVENFIENYGFSNNAARAIGFTEIFKFLNRDLSEKEALLLIQQRTRQYAKRQRTWFRHQFKADKVIHDVKCIA